MTGETSDIEALLRMANINQKEIQKALKDSRIANKYYQEELEKCKATVTSIIKSVAESAKKHLQERETAKLELQIIISELKKKEAELKKKEAELKKKDVQLKKKVVQLKEKDEEINRLKETGPKESIKPTFPSMFSTEERVLIHPKGKSFSRFNFGSSASHPAKNNPFRSRFSVSPVSSTTQNKEPVLPPAFRYPPEVKTRKNAFIFGSRPNNEESVPQFTFNLPSTQTKLNIPPRRIPLATPPPPAKRSPQQNLFALPPNPPQ